MENSKQEIQQQHESAHTGENHMCAINVMRQLSQYTITGNRTQQLTLQLI